MGGGGGGGTTPYFLFIILFLCNGICSIKMLLGIVQCMYSRVFTVGEHKATTTRTIFHPLLK